MGYLLLADAVGLVHIGIVLAPMVIIITAFRGRFQRNKPWGWIAASFMASFILADVIWYPSCPITLLEDWLLAKYSPDAVYYGGFIQHWVLKLFGFWMPAKVITTVGYVELSLLIFITLSTISQWYQEGILASWMHKIYLSIK